MPVPNYQFNYQLPNAEPLYGSRNNCIVWEQRQQGGVILETRWYEYNKLGHVQRIVTERHPDPNNPDPNDPFLVERFNYNGNGQMWLYRTYTCRVDPNATTDPNSWVAVGTAGLSAWEFRYAGDRRRYLVRERDPNVPGSWPNTYLAPLAGAPARWHEYVGDQIHRDFGLAGGALSAQASYVQAGEADGEVFAISEAAGTRYFHADLIGTSRLLTGSGGAVTQALGFTAFGERLGTAPTGAPRYGYAGAWGYQDDRLADAGWSGPAALHVGARYYAPALGRFLMRDPIGIFGGMNVYAYNRACPTTFVDPSGAQSYAGQIGAIGIQSTLLTLYRGALAVSATATGWLAWEMTQFYPAMSEWDWLGDRWGRPGWEIGDAVEDLKDDLGIPHDENVKVDPRTGKVRDSCGNDLDANLHDYLN
ncbi:MAG: RHS repeat-associated core domain-containing protein [Planctomycetota bacterium]